MRPEPDARERQWVSGRRADELGTTALTVAEIRHGIERLPDGRRKADLLSAATDLFAGFGDLVQPFDARAAAWFGPVMVRLAVDAEAERVRHFPVACSSRGRSGAGSWRRRAPLRAASFPAAEDFP
ncbi:MAG TPA: hypothetical protein VFO01_16595 [Trebonia sp.]|nr:hypothetical protein [Trebonia sp.]